MYDELVKRLREHNGWALNETLDQAADVRPVVKGHWTNHRTLFTDGDWYCSACGHWQSHGATKYCPNCGAKMQNSLKKVEANSKKSLEKVEEDDG